MDATDVDRKDRARSWRTVAAGGAVATVVAVTSSLGWWDGSGRTEEPAPDVEVVGAAPAETRRRPRGVVHAGRGRVRRDRW